MGGLYGGHLGRLDQWVILGELLLAHRLEIELAAVLLRVAMRGAKVFSAAALETSEPGLLLAVEASHNGGLLDRGGLWLGRGGLGVRIVDKGFGGTASGKSVGFFFFVGNFLLYAETIVFVGNVQGVLWEKDFLFFSVV